MRANRISIKNTATGIATSKNNPSFSFILKALVIIILLMPVWRLLNILLLQKNAYHAIMIVDFPWIQMGMEQLLHISVRTITILCVNPVTGQTLIQSNSYSRMEAITTNQQLPLVQPATRHR